MDIVFFSVLFVIVVVALTFMYVAFSNQHSAMVRDNLAELRRVVDECEVRYSRAMRRYDADSTDDTLAALKRASAECRQARAQLYQCETSAIDAGITL